MDDLITVVNELNSLTDEVEVLRGADGKTYIRIQTNNDAEAITLSLRSPDFAKWLARQYRKKLGKSIPKRFLSDFIDDFGHDTPEREQSFPVGNRLATSPRQIYLDLGSVTGNAIELTAKGWKCVSLSDTDAIFPHLPHSLGLSEPTHGGSVDHICSVFNLPSSVGVVVIAWLLNCLQSGPYQALVIVGPDAGARNTLAEFIRDLLDPSSLPLRLAPKNESEISAAANNSFILGYDGRDVLSSVSQELLSQILIGTAFRSCRAGREEIIFNGRRPDFQWEAPGRVDVQQPCYNRAEAGQPFTGCTTGNVG